MRGVCYTGGMTSDIGAAVMKADYEREALELSVQGWSDSEISDHQGVTVGTVRSRISRAIRDRVPKSLVEEARAVQKLRLDGLVRFYVGVIKDPKVTLDSKLRAAAGLQNTVADLRKMLGLDEPVVVKVDIPSKMDDEIAELLTQMGIQDLLTAHPERDSVDSD